MSRPPIKCWRVEPTGELPESCADWIGIHVTGTNYYPDYIAEAKQLGAKWCKEERAWVFPLDSWAKVDALITRYWCSQAEPRHQEVLLKVKVGGEGGLQPDEKQAIFVCGQTMKVQLYSPDFLTVRAPACVAQREMTRLGGLGVTCEWVYYKGAAINEQPPWQKEYLHVAAPLPSTEKPALPVFNYGSLAPWDAEKAEAKKQKYKQYYQPQQQPAPKPEEPPRRMIVMDELKRQR